MYEPSSSKTYFMVNLIFQVNSRKEKNILPYERENYALFLRELISILAKVYRIKWDLSTRSIALAKEKVIVWQR